jgi:hypothetical protein
MDWRITMASQPRLIGLIGRKGSGKDTAALTLLNQGYQNVKFAGALKDMIRTVLAYQGLDAGSIERMVEGDLKEVATDYLAGQTPRFAMQTLGTEWGRDLIAPDFWVGTTIRKAGDLKTVITDVRFPNEMDAVTNAGGFCFGITADWISATEGEHESEALIDDLIAALPATQKIINRRAAAGEEAYAIQEFQMRFLTKLSAL